jgi:hypothetical protein
MCGLQGPKRCQPYRKIVSWNHRSNAIFADGLAEAELHEPIESCMPDLVALLQDGDWRIQLAGAEALSTLAEHGVLKRKVKTCCH